LGTRFLPATKATPKELFPIHNKPALLYHIIEAYKSGIRRVCLIISKEKECVKKLFTHNKDLEENLKATGKTQLLEELNEVIDNMEFTYVYQNQKKYNGTGGALYFAKKFCGNRPFALMFGDDLCVSNTEVPTIGQLIEAYNKTGKVVVGEKPFPMEVIHKYSSLVTGEKLFDRCYELKDSIEKPEKGKAPSNLVGLARYVFTPEIFDYIFKVPELSLREYRLADAIQLMSHEGKVVSYEFDAKYYDCGNKLEFIKCVLEFGLKDQEIAEDLQKYLADLNKPATAKVEKKAPAKKTTKKPATKTVKATTAKTTTKATAKPKTTKTKTSAKPKAKKSK
ncbi:MAG: UTP--glucose-1-phosphate uridylyltransferase, partial [Clostridia bacterium]|nr:UTP--glucose-1-phosphate uridylyltransferase [Clostridia bacterium]